MLSPLSDKLDYFNSNLQDQVAHLSRQLEDTNTKLDYLYRSSFHEDTWLNKARNLHKGKRCFIIGTGPSLNRVDLSKIKNEITFGVNGTYKIESLNLNYFVYVSSWFHEQHSEGIKNVTCERRFIPSSHQGLESHVPTSWLNVLLPSYYDLVGNQLQVPSGFSYAPHKAIFAGGTVIFLCLQLAYYMGFDKVITLGLDHSFGKFDENAKQHAGTYIREEKNISHFDSKYNSENIEYHCDLKAMERGYKLALEAFNEDNRVIVNASPGSKLDIFPKINFEQLF